MGSLNSESKSTTQNCLHNCNNLNDLNDSLFRWLQQNRMHKLFLCMWTIFFSSSLWIRLAQFGGSVKQVVTDSEKKIDSAHMWNADERRTIRNQIHVNRSNRWQCNEWMNDVYIYTTHSSHTAKNAPKYFWPLALDRSRTARPHVCNEYSIEIKLSRYLCFEL